MKKKCQNHIKNGKSAEYTAAFCIEYIRASLEEMTDKILQKYGDMPVVYAGGVMSNSIINNSFTEKYNAVFAQPVFSSDNAAGTACLCYRKFNDVHT